MGDRRTGGRDGTCGAVVAFSPSKRATRVRIPGGAVFSCAMDFLIDFLLGNPLGNLTGPPWKTFSRSSVSHEIFWDGSINVIAKFKTI